MLVTMKQMLDIASKENYAVAAPNVCNELDIRASIYAAEKMNAPIILDIATSMTADVTFLGRYAAQIANETPVPVALNLDHGGGGAGAHDDTLVIRDVICALKGDVTSVMVDKSSCSYEENVNTVKEMAKIVHTIGVSIEAEIGHVGQGDDDETLEERTAQMTTPEQAAEYVKATGVDCLAVAIGNSHGAYKNGTPHIDFERLAQIKKAVNGLPLVLHGGSGTGAENLRKACSMGINKVNLCNDLLANVGKELKAADFEGNGCYDIWAIIQKAYAEKLMELIELLGGKDKAWEVKKEYIPFENKLLVASGTH